MRGTITAALELGLIFAMGAFVWFAPALTDWAVGYPSADQRLILASATHDHEMFDQALADHGSPKAMDLLGDGALANAASYGEIEWVRRLIDRGADINAADNWGSTPLMHAAMHDQLEIVQLLLERGADPNARTQEFHFSALDLAIISGADRCAVFLRQRGVPASISRA